MSLIVCNHLLQERIPARQLTNGLELVDPLQSFDLVDEQVQQEDFFSPPGLVLGRAPCLVVLTERGHNGIDLSN